MNDRRQESDVGTDIRTDVRTGVRPSGQPEIHSSTEPEVYRTTVVTSTTDAQEPSLGDLVVGLTDDVTTLLRKEVELAKAELQETVQEGAQAGGMIAAGGMVAYAGLLLILIALAIALGDWWENYWLGAAVVGLLTALIGWAVLNSGLKQLKEVSLVPRKTMASLGRDAEMAKEKLS